MINLLGSLAALMRRFGRDKAGNFAITFGIALIPLVGAVGTAIDYTVASRIRTQLLAAADAASVGAIAKSSPGFKAAATMAKDGPIPEANADAVNIFNAEMSGRTGFELSSVTANVTKIGLTLSSTVQFSAEVPVSFLGIFGLSSLSVAGTSKATNSIPTFIDFYLLLDNTPSMGVAATPADVTTMVNNTKDQCAFGCHDTSDSNNYYNLAHKLGVTMRIDVLRTATQQLMDTATATATFSNQFRMAIYTFGTSAQNLGLTTITSLTTNLSSAKTQAGNIDLMKVPYQNYNDDQDTDYDDVMSDIEKEIPKPGDGSSASKPQKVLLFVSDGVGDAKKNGKRTIAPIDVALCTKIKKRDIRIAVLYTTYLPLPTNDFYNKNVAPFASQIGPTMKSCASPDLYFEVSPTEGIADAMNKLFQKAVAQARLTQ